MKNILILTFLLYTSSLVSQEDFGDTITNDGKCISGNCTNGFGVKKYDDATLYIGEWWDDLPSGQGTVVWSDGSIYVGGFIKGLYQGEGTFMGNMMNKNILYIGDFEKDKPHGFGTIFLENGDYYVGGFEEGLFNGTGYLQHKNNNLEEGVWKNGNIIGDTILTQENYIKKGIKK